MIVKRYFNFDETTQVHVRCGASGIQHWGDPTFMLNTGLCRIWKNEKKAGKFQLLLTYF